MRMSTRLQALAYEWHGGQASPLYRMASSIRVGQYIPVEIVRSAGYELHSNIRCADANYPQDVSDIRRYARMMEV